MVYEHSKLAERKAGEHSNCVERNECVDDTAECNYQKRRGNAKKNHTVGEHQTISAVHELAWQVIIFCDDRRQPREVCVCGIRCQNQNCKRCKLSEEEHDISPTVNLLGKLSQNGVGNVALFVFQRLQVLRKNT